MALPSRERADEDRWIAELASASDEDVVAAVREAVEAGRPALAARAVGLIAPDDDEDPELAKARRAARFLLMSETVPAWEDLDPLLQVIRKRRLTRAKDRARRSLSKPPAELPLHRRRKRRR